MLSIGSQSVCSAALKTFIPMKHVSLPLSFYLSSLFAVYVAAICSPPCLLFSSKTDMINNFVHHNGFLLLTHFQSMATMTALCMGWKNGRMGGWMDGPTDRRTDVWIDG